MSQLVTLRPNDLPDLIRASGVPAQTRSLSSSSRTTAIRILARHMAWRSAVSCLVQGRRTGDPG